MSAPPGPVLTCHQGVLSHLVCCNARAISPKPLGNRCNPYSYSTLACLRQWHVSAPVSCSLATPLHTPRPQG
jgi:hypothetical protein